MRKHFLLFFLMALLPMAGWAQSLSYTTAKWDGSSHAFPTVTINDGTIPVGTTYYETGNNRYRVNYWRKSGSTNNLTQYQDAGDYVATVEHQSRANQYSAWGSTTYTTLDFTVNKAYPVVNLYGFQKEYSDPWTEPTVQTMPTSSYAFDTDGTNLTWNGIRNNLTWSRSSTSHDVGEYGYTLTVGGTLTNSNYEVKVNSIGTFDIVPSDGTWTTTPVGKATGNTAKYDGTDKTVADLIATPAVYSGGTVEYSLDGLAWSEDLSTIVVGKDAKSYSIQYRGNGDKNHNDIAGGTFTVLIDPYEVTVGTDFNALTAITPNVYTGSAKPLVNEVAWTGTFASELAGAVIKYNSATAIPTETNVGVYPVALTFDFTATPNFTYAGAAISVDGEITKADIVAADVTAPTGKTGLTYKLDTPQQLINAAVCTKGVAWYSVDGGAWDTDITKVVGEHVKANNAPYVVSWYIVGDANHNDYGSTTTPAGTVEVTIAPVQFALTADAEVATGLVFDNTAQPLLSKSVTGGAANMPVGSTTWSLNGTALAAGSVYTDVKGTNAGEYTISYTVVPKDAKYENDYLPYTKELKATIGQYTLYIGAKTLSGTVEDFFDLTTTPVTAKFKMSDFLKDGAFIGGETDEQKAAILNQLIQPTQTMDEIIANAKVGSNIIGLKAVVVEPTAENPMNYKVDAATLLSDNASLDIEAKEAAIQAAPVGYADGDLTYNGENQKLVKTAGVGYKANGGTGTVAIGKIVYSLTGEDGSWTDDVTSIDIENAIVGKDADEYEVFYNVELDDKDFEDKFYEYTGGVKSFKVKIGQKALADEMFVLTPTEAEFNGKNQLPVITTKDGEPIVDADYSFEFADGDGNKIADINTGVVNADAYAITFTAEADGNYKGTASATWTITKKALAADMFVFSADVEYNGQYQKPTITTKEGEPIVAADYTFAVTDGEDAPIDVEKLINADAYTFTFTATADGNYKTPTESVTKVWNITQKPLTADMFVFTEGVTFDGKAHKPTITTKEGEPIVAADYGYTITDGEDASIDEAKLIDADTYTYTFEATADGNYKNPAVAIEWTIAQATATIVLPEKINLTYNGGEQALVTEGTTDAVAGTDEIAGKVEYAIGDAEFAEALPEAKDAGVYTVNYRITASEKNYTNPEVTGNFDVTINKATIGYTLSNLEKTWDGEPFGADEIGTLFTLTAGGDGTKLFGDDEYDKPFTLSLPEDYRDAGTYTFKQPKVEFKEGYPVNYNVNFTGEAEVVINKADIVAADFTAPTAIAGVGYTGEEQAIVEEGEVTNTYQYPEMEEALPIGKMVYATAADATEWSENAPKGTEAGEYDVYFKIEGDKNHNDFEATLIEDVAIATATLTEDFLPEEYETELPYKAAAYEASDFIPALVGITEDEGYQVYAAEMKDAGNYVITFKGINNYASEFDVAVKVTPIDVIAVAPKGIKKVYDGTASLEGVITNEDITFVGVLSGDQIAVPEALALSTEGIAVSDKPYAITVDAAAINAIAANKNYNILDETIDGTLTITKAPAFKVGFDEVPVWTKAFGEEDPALTDFTVTVTDGEFYDDIDDVLDAATAKRAPGEDVDTYDVTLEFDATAAVFANYEGVEFDGTAAEFTITKSDKVYTVSVANVSKTYNGEEFDTAIEVKADNLIIAGYEGDLDKFFTDLPTAAIPAGAKDAGDYNITLADGESQNYKFTFVPATFTIEPFEVTTATIEAQKVQKGKELDVTKFTITAPAADADLFYVTAPGLVNMEDIVTGAAGVYEDGLVIAVDESVVDNYTGLDKFTAELEIIDAEAIVLSDDDDVETVAKENQTVTFSSRSINTDTWNVMVLPFATTPAEISDAFGFAAVDVLNETANDGAIHFSLLTSGTIEAGQPFIVKPTNDYNAKENFNQVVFYDVDVEAFSDNTYRQDGANNKFWGTFQETKFYGAEYWYMSKGMWKDASKYTSSKPVTLKPLRAYVEFAPENVATARIFIEEPDGSTTALDAVEFNNMINGEGWYTIDGKKLEAAPTQKGVYINNGKKVVVK